MDPRADSPLTELPPFEVHIWLKLEAGSAWVSVLSIPSDDISLYTLRPLKWLRFLGFAIYGHEGTLSATPDGPEVDDYNTADVESLQESYYYSSPDTPRLVDVQGINDRKSDAYTHSHTSQADFANDIVSRDSRCVMSGAGRLICDAAHLIPHSKGDAYIGRLTGFRGDLEDLIEEINDPRNGLLLAKTFHAMLGPGFMAFLKTPNFALNTDDIPPSTRPVSGPSGRLTLQYFEEPDPYLTMVAPFNQDAHPPNDLTTWPPSVITDFFYACAALKKWGSDNSTAMLRQLTMNHYYKDGLPEGSMSQNHEQQKQDRTARLTRCNEQKSSSAHKSHTNIGEGKCTTPAQRPQMGEIMDWLIRLRSMHMDSDPQPQLQGCSDDKEEWLQEWLQTQ